jgi:lipopolysaccharide/colanic/teichoic acid biosynthesis glycosyltransferase
MRPVFRIRTFLLFLGDVVVLSAAVWLSLVLRALDFPHAAVLERYFEAHGILLAVWLVVFAAVGLYEKRVLVFPRVQARRLAFAQGINALVAALVFFLVPQFGIAPKTILAINLLVSLLLVAAWRLWAFTTLFGSQVQNVLIFGRSKELTELEASLSATGLFRVSSIARSFGDADSCAFYRIAEQISERRPDLVILDVRHPTASAALQDMYSTLARGVCFVDAAEAYEDVFGRVSLAGISESWVVHNLSRHDAYDSLKRAADIVVGGTGLLVAVILFPIIMLAIRLESRGPGIIVQERVGQYERRVRLYKFRTMDRNDTSLSMENGPNRVTAVGAILRRTRLDELPQLFNVLRGDLSLIGPRPELAAGVALYEVVVPNYRIRHLIKPGLSGWAQLYHDNHPHHCANIEATREKLSYDLYYVKHRSFFLDVIVGLKTIAKLLTLSGT